MKTLQDTYPVFEANQVLTNAHLNEMFNYLDEQGRLTRANLIGIGIVCGLEIQLVSAPPAVQLSRGCGVTSEGYLIVEPEDVVLVSYREYKLPKDLDYSPFKDKSTDPKEPYPLWELFPAGEPNTTLLGSPTDFLSDKAVLLFLELKREGLRTCSPNDCDDKGFKITATVRRLLVKVNDLKKIIAEANQLDAGLTISDLEAALTARLDLPDLCLPRYDVPNSGPATSNEVLAAFHAVFHTSTLVSNTEKALSAAYDAFKPIVRRAYPSNPFTNLSANFGFWDNAPTTTAQVRFLPYYYDFFDDLLKAYDELRRKGAALLCACCPPEGLFPRHLMLAVLDPDSVGNPGAYRHHFIASSAVGDCEGRTKELMQLFQRLVEMIARFTSSPPLPKPSATSETDVQIRITPSKSNVESLSDKAIPYYYLQNGTPPLYRIWNAERTRRNRANQNLSYRSDEYTPTAPAFVTNALRYDLEPHDFLRIEGHLGKNFRDVLKTLLTLKTRFRLPIEIVALRTGAFDENEAIDLSKEQCRFQDLETLYNTLRDSLVCHLCESVRYFYSIQLEKFEFNGGAPKLLLLKECAPKFSYEKNTVGAWYESHLKEIQAKSYFDVDPKSRIEEVLQKIFAWLFVGTKDPGDAYYAYIVSIYYCTTLYATLQTRFDRFRYADFENKYHHLMRLIGYFRSVVKDIIPKQLTQFIPLEDLIDRFDAILAFCKLGPFKALIEAYASRIREIKKKQFLSFFLQKNPGIQHKAGVPLGGTFIIVYHDEAELTLTDRPIDFDEIREKIRATATDGTTKVDSAAIADAFKRISKNPALVDDPDIRFLLGTVTGKVPDVISRPTAGDAIGKLIQKTVDELGAGTVIADFFLPYLCCSDCAPVQYVLPTPPLGLLVELGCTDPNGTVEATLTPQGGMAPFSYQLDKQPFRELSGKLVLSVGPHTLVIRDNTGSESALQQLNVPNALTIGAETYTDVSEKQYTVSFSVSGGTPPYSADSGTIVGKIYTSDPVESEKAITVEISDSRKCEIESKEFKHTVCRLPCKGIARRCGFRFWIPEPDKELKRVFKRYSAKVPVFSFDFPEGRSVDLSGEVESIIQADVRDLNDTFNDVIQSWLEHINKLIAHKTGSDDWLRLEYQMLASDSVGTLWIEYFECLKFQFHIQSEFQRPEVSDLLDMVYTPKGTSIENLETNLPPFNCVRIDKCDPSRPTEDLCKDVDMQLKIFKKLTDSKTVSLDVSPSGNDKPTAFLWEVLDGVPAVSNNKKMTFTFRQLEPKIKIIRLAAFTENGCRVVATDFVNLKPD